MDVAFLVEFIAPLAMLVVPPILLARTLTVGDGGSLEDLFAIPLDPPRARGMQEEEPVRWRLEHLRSRSIEGDSQPLRRVIPAFDAKGSGC